MGLNLENTYWDRVKGFVTELRVDGRWILRDNDDKPYGSLRITSHPDLQPGYLRAIFTYITNKKGKTDSEILQTIEDYKIDITELEVYSIGEDIETETQTYEAPLRELEELYAIKVFE